MTTQSIDYNTIMHDALAQVVRRILSQVAQDGLPGAHHFYITFLAREAGVVVPESIRRGEEEITIALQHRFENLTVTDEGFSVVLWFSGAPAHISVPFAALTRFLDPHADFGLRLTRKTRIAEDTSTPATPVSNAAAEGGDDDTQRVVSLDAFRKKKPGA